jgi:hypothetical protein
MWMLRFSLHPFFPTRLTVLMLSDWSRKTPTVSRDVRGIGFRTANQIAARLGIE